VTKQFFQRLFFKLIFLPFAFSIHASQLATPSELRHLLDSWPHSSSAKEEEIEKEPSRANRRVLSQLRSIEYRLESWIDILSSHRSEKCRGFYVISLKDLLAHLQKERPLLLQTLAEIEQSLYLIESELRECDELDLEQAWYLEKNTSLAAQIFLETQAESSPRSHKQSDLGVALEGVYKNSTIWSSLATKASLGFVENSKNESPYSLKQENVIQFSKNALRTQFYLERQFKSYPSQFDERRYVSQTWGVGSGLRFPLGDRYHVFSAGLLNEKWGDDFWRRKSFMLNYQAGLRERGAEALKLFVDFERVLLLEPLSVYSTSIGFIYEESFSHQENSFLKLGVQDRRQAEGAASLWPVFELSARGRDLTWINLYPSWFLGLLPVETPWSVNTLRADSQFSLTYQKDAILWPVRVSLLREFHRSLPQGRRDDVVLGLSTAPSYFFSKNWKIDTELSVSQRWILFSENSPETTTVLYPGKNDLSYKGMARLSYVF
jgi:hypothetical protein